MNAAEAQLVVTETHRILNKVPEMSDVHSCAVHNPVNHVLGPAECDSHQVMILRSHRRYRCTVRIVVSGGEEIARVQGHWDFAGKRPRPHCSQEFLPCGENQHGLPEHGEVAVSIPVTVWLTRQIQGAGCDGTHEECGHVELLPGQRIVAEDHNHFRVEADGLGGRGINSCC